MKKTLTILLALALLVSALCVPCALADDTVELNVWMLGKRDQVDADMVWEEWNKLLAENVPNTKVNFYIPADYASEFKMALASDEAIDMAWLGWYFDIGQLAKDGTVLPLNDLLNEYGKGIIESLGEKTIENHRLDDGELYAVPSYQGLVDGRRGIAIPTQLVALQREGWAEELQTALYAYYHDASLETQAAVLDLLTEFLAACKEQKQLYAGVNPINLRDYLIPMAGFAKNDMAEMGYVTWNDDTFTVHNAFDDGYYRQFAKYASEWYQAGYVPADIMTGSYNTAWDTELTANDFAMWVMQWVVTKDIWQEMKSAQFNMDVTIFEARDEWTTCLGNATSVGIPYTSRNPERAIQVLEQMYANKDVYRMWVYGIEGVHFTLNDDGTLHQLVDSETGAKRYGMDKWAWGTCLNSIQEENISIFEYDYCKQWEAEAYNSPFLQFRFDNTDVADEMTGCKSILEGNLNAILAGSYGDKWEEAYDKLFADLESSGMRKILDAAQTQVSDFRAAHSIESWNWGK